MTGTDAGRPDATAPRRVVLLEHDPAWAHRFGALREQLWPQLQDVATGLEHVGSTAVPGLAAKPIIDADIIVASARGLQTCIERLAGLGYRYLGEQGIPGRHAFEPPAGAPAHQPYVCLDGALSLRNHLVLRDHLRAHPEDARAYGELKKRLAARYPENIESYVEGKTAFIVGILSRYLTDAEQDRLMGEIIRPNQAGSGPAQPA